jgi:hypothetical protein
VPIPTPPALLGAVLGRASEADGVALALACSVEVALGCGVLLADGDEVAPAELVGVAVGVADGVADAVGVAVGVGVAEPLRLELLDGVLDGEVVADAELELEAEADGVAVTDVLGVLEGVAEVEGAGDEEAVGVALGEIVAGLPTVNTATAGRPTGVPLSDTWLTHAYWPFGSVTLGCTVMPLVNEPVSGTVTVPLSSVVPFVPSTVTGTPETA